MTNTPPAESGPIGSGLAYWRRAPLRAAIVAALAVTAVFVGGALINAERPQGTTDNAYVRADMTLVSPKVRGMIDKGMVAENQVVNAGDPLVQIDSAEDDARPQAAESDLIA